MDKTKRQFKFLIHSQSNVSLLFPDLTHNSNSRSSEEEFEKEKKNYKILNKPYKNLAKVLMLCSSHQEMEIRFIAIIIIFSHSNASVPNQKKKKKKEEPKQNQNLAQSIQFISITKTKNRTTKQKALIFRKPKRACTWMHNSANNTSNFEFRELLCIQSSKVMHNRASCSLKKKKHTLISIRFQLNSEREWIRN